MSMKMNISASNLARVMICAGYLSFKDLPKFQAHPAADEGTTAGEVLEHYLLGSQLPLQSKVGLPFNDEMKFYARTLSEEIKSIAESPILCEQNVDWQTQSGIWIRARLDVSFVSKGVLYVDDYKYGWGIVEAEENWQLLSYAIGEVLRRGQAFNEVALRIHQPRPHHENGPTREWRISYGKLLEYKDRIEARMRDLVDGNRTLTAGAGACKYCAAAAEACPAFNRLFYQGVEVSTSFVQDAIDEKELARQIDIAERAADNIKIKLDSLRELAINRMKKGTLVPGYTTKSNYSKRQWKPGVSNKFFKTVAGIDVTETKMLSPAQVEKMGVPKAVVNKLAQTRYIGEQLVKQDAAETANKIFGVGAPKEAK